MPLLVKLVADQFLARLGLAGRFGVLAALDSRAGSPE
jgi:hypothetical protein